MIDREHSYPSCAGEASGFSRGSVYHLPRPVSDGDLALMRRIDELHLDYPLPEVGCCKGSEEKV